MLCACINATTVEESIPPERKAPSGTSAIIRNLTEFAQQRVEPLDRLVFVRSRIVARLAGDGDAAQVPKASRRRRRAPAQRQNMAGRKLRGFAIDRARLRDVGVAQVTCDSIVVDRRLPARDGAQRLELGGEQHALRASPRSRAA